MLVSFYILVFLSNIIFCLGMLILLKNKKDVLRLEREIDDIKTNINQYSDDYFNQQIEENWEILKEKEAIKNLKSMPIDTVSTLEKGMPINVLMHYGLRTIYDARHKDRHDLM